jgi:hypothetical protein
MIRRPQETAMPCVHTVAATVAACREKLGGCRFADSQNR